MRLKDVGMNQKAPLPGGGGGGGRPLGSGRQLPPQPTVGRRPLGGGGGLKGGFREGFDLI